MTEFIYFEDSWNEPRKENRTGEVLKRGVESTREKENDSKRPW